VVRLDDLVRPLRRVIADVVNRVILSTQNLGERFHAGASCCVLTSLVWR
jgi:hypothetical protein